MTPQINDKKIVEEFEKLQIKSYAIKTTLESLQSDPEIKKYLTAKAKYTKDLKTLAVLREYVSDEANIKNPAYKTVQEAFYKMLAAFFDDNLVLAEFDNNATVEDYLTLKAKHSKTQKAILSKMPIAFEAKQRICPHITVRVGGADYETTETTCLECHKRDDFGYNNKLDDALISYAIIEPQNMHNLIHSYHLARSTYGTDNIDKIRELVESHVRETSRPKR